MTIIVSIDVIKNTICTPAGEELVRYAEEKGLTELSFDETIAHWKALGKRGWAVWLYKNKSIFEKLANTQSTEEENSAHNADFEYLSNQNTLYLVNGIKYNSLEEAKQARENQLEFLKSKTEPLVVCSLETFNENGDSIWVSIDLDDFSAPIDKSYVIKVFSPVNGIYDSFTSLEEALLKRNENMTIVADSMFGSAVIREILQHPDFPDDNSE